MITSCCVGASVCIIAGVVYYCARTFDDILDINLTEDDLLTNS